MARNGDGVPTCDTMSFEFRNNGVRTYKNRFVLTAYIFMKRLITCNVKIFLRMINSI